MFRRLAASVIPALALLTCGVLLGIYFPTTLLPMGLATAAGSLVSVLVCVVAYAILRRKEAKTT